MSGGHYDYLSLKVNEFAFMIEINGEEHRRKFQIALEAAAKACKAIEWEDSGDTNAQDTKDAISNFFKVCREIDGTKKKN